MTDDVAAGGIETRVRSANRPATGIQSRYDNEFFAYTDEQAVRSAKILAALVYNHFAPESVADFGCGSGGWLSVWRNLGVAEIVGVDGPWIDQEQLLIDRSEFIEHNLDRPIRMERKFDLVQSLEVAEHLPPSAAEGFVDVLTSHSNVVLFSAAPPGDGGMQHVNERPYEYWRSLFRRRGFVMLDLVRPMLQNRSEVESWYRYNTFVYVSESLTASLPSDVMATRVNDGSAVRDFAPWSFKLRRHLVRPLPVSAVNLLSRMKMRLRSRRQ